MNIQAQKMKKPIEPKKQSPVVESKLGHILHRLKTNNRPKQFDWSNGCTLWAFWRLIVNILINLKPNPRIRTKTFKTKQQQKRNHQPKQRNSSVNEFQQKPNKIPIPAPIQAIIDINQLPNPNIKPSINIKNIITKTCTVITILNDCKLPRNKLLPSCANSTHINIK